MTTREARRLALINDADTARLIRLGTLASARIGAQMQRAAATAFSAGRDPSWEIAQFVDPLRLVLVSGMLASRLAGIRRARILLPEKLTLSVSDEYEKAVRSLSSLLDISEPDLDRLTDSMNAHALRIVRGAADEAVARVREEMASVTSEGLHVREGTKRIRSAFQSAGLVPANSFTAEAIFRTQTRLAYAAGKLDVEQSPPVQEILWGYRYATVGDDRVRPAHAALEGVTLPKSSTFWDTNYPPNGWACRCEALPLFEPVEIVLPPQPYNDDGVLVVPGADAGFRFRADRLFGSFASIAMPANALLN